MAVDLKRSHALRNAEKCSAAWFKGGYSLFLRNKRQANSAVVKCEVVARSPFAAIHERDLPGAQSPRHARATRGCRS